LVPILKKSANKQPKDAYAPYKKAMNLPPRPKPIETENKIE